MKIFSDERKPREFEDRIIGITQPEQQKEISQKKKGYLSIYIYKDT